MPVSFSRRNRNGARAIGLLSVHDIWGTVCWQDPRSSRGPKWITYWPDTGRYAARLAGMETPHFDPKALAPRPVRRGNAFEETMERLLQGLRWRPADPAVGNVRNDHPGLLEDTADGLF